MAVTVKLSSKNQIVVPKPAREALGLRPGDRLVVTVRDDDVVEMRRRGEDPAAELEGMFPVAGGAADPDAGLWPEVRSD